MQILFTKGTSLFFPIYVWIFFISYIAGAVQGLDTLNPILTLDNGLKLVSSADGAVPLVHV